jgi:hypothetical protein
MKRHVLPVLAVFSTILLIVSCATASVPVSRQKPSDIDLSGIKRIAVLPAFFPEDVTETPVQDGILKCASDYKWNSTVNHEISNYFLTRLSYFLGKKTKFLYVDNTEIAKCIPVDEKALAAKNASIGGKLSNAAKWVFSSETAVKEAPTVYDPTTIVDAYVIVTVTGMSSSLDSTLSSQKNSEGRDEAVMIETKILKFDYKMGIYRASDSTLIGEKVVSKQITSVETGKDSFFNVKSDKTLALEAIDATFTELTHAFVPYKADEKISLESDTSKNPDMIAAEKLVNKKKYADAGAIYTRVYAETNLFAAGFNAAIMTEMAGDLPGAIAAMDALSQDSGNPKASAELQRMQQTLTDQTRLQAIK